MTLQIFKPLRYISQLLKPTLVRRVVLALLIAFLLTYLIIFSWSMYLMHVDAPRNLKTIARQFSTSVADVSSPAEARGALGALDQILKAQARSNDGLRPGAGMILRDLREPKNAPPVYASSVLMEGGLEHDGADHCLLHGEPCIAVHVPSSHWDFALYFELPDLRRKLSSASQLLTPRFLVAFPLVLLPIWLAVLGGLKPLRRLSKHIAERRSEDLTPLDQDLRYGELQPLGQALNSMFAKVRLRIERERAFVEDAAHELRTPLAVISAQAHVLARAEAPEARTMAEQSMAGALERASHLVQQLLSLARMDAATPAQVKRLDLAELTRELLANHAERADQAGIELTLDAPDHLVCFSDAQALSSILGNLIENALHYAGQGAHVDLVLRQRITHLSIDVKDDGPGIAEAERSRVFERFYRGQEANQQNSQGSGLGLAIVSQAVHRLNGRLSLNSGPGGRGCHFRVELPLNSPTN